MLQTTHRLNFPNYNFVRTDSNTVASGRETGILVQDNINYERINTQSWNLKSLEVTAVLIKTDGAALAMDQYEQCLPGNPPYTLCRTYFLQEEHTARI